MASSALTWEGDRAEAPDGTVYLLNAEDAHGRHGGRMWWVLVYAPGANRPTRLDPPDGWPTKPRARAVAQHHANEKIDRA